MPFEFNTSGSIDFFPVPKPFQSVELPGSAPIPGASPASTAALREVLKDNHTRSHCYFNDAGFHNHAPHSAIALWHLGADAETIKAGYAASSSYQRPAFASPGPINKDNWTEHLGDDKYYGAYLAFFAGEYEDKGPSAVLEEYVFSDAVNYPINGKRVQMLNRFLDGLLHPLIHLGYGYELGLPGMIVEGLAQTAVHQGESDCIIPAILWERSVRGNFTPSLLSIFARILADPEIRPPMTADHATMYSGAVQKNHTFILKHTDAWSFDVTKKGALSQALEEIAWVATLMYAISGYAGKDANTFNADIYCTHLITSSVFLSSIAGHLQPGSQEILLRSHVAVMFAWFVALGKPDLDIKAFFSDDKTAKSLITTAPTHTGPSHVLSDSSKASPNPWAEIIQLSILHPDEHVHKLQRSLVQYAQLYSTREVGYFGDTELKDGDKIDGTLFVRAANLSALKVNRSPEVVEIAGGELPLYWGMRGYYEK